MPRVPALQSVSWPELAAGQGGVVSARQLVALGLSADQARQWVRSERWRRIFPGVFSTFSGPLPHLSLIWAAILYAGPEAAASHGTALWLAGLSDAVPSTIEIIVPGIRRVRAPPGVTIRRSSRFDDVIHPAAAPPRTKLEEAVLDQAAQLGPEAVLTLVFRATQRRHTTAARLRDALAKRGRHRWRALMREVLADVDDGVASALERRYLRDVERAHGLPSAERNRPEVPVASPAQSRYVDIRLDRWRLVIELDGREAHPDEQRFRDLGRDNVHTTEGSEVLRYGWHDVAIRPCEVAAQVLLVLRRKGWTSQPRPCGPACPIR